MTSSHCWVNGKSHIINKNEFDAELFKSDESFKMLHRCAVLCNDAQFDDTRENLAKDVFSREVMQNGSFWEFSFQCVCGNASDHGLLKFGEFVEAGSINKLRSEYLIAGQGP